MNMRTAVTTVVGKYATFSGRAPRSEYWWWVLALMLLIALVLDNYDTLRFRRVERKRRAQA